jgi:hypothetical protein
MMAVQAIAAAAVPVVAQSATSEDGLLNKAFKIVIIGALLGVALLIIYIISILGGLTDLGEIALLKTGLAFFNLGAGGTNPFFTLLGAGLTGLGALAIRR